MLLGLCLLLFSCVSAVVGAVVGTTVEVVKVPFIVVGAAVDLAVSDDDLVLSDECELVSARTMKPPVMPHRVDATQQERRFG